ncbi:MAG: hypothetical protein NZ765_05915 [Anaerolineae bacterium]|nr:hypothetical protein [Anaerolineae bacterium]MDW8071103.1 hypothetical protein [Anaerolineae bacterium]
MTDGTRSRGMLNSTRVSRELASVLNAATTRMDALGHAVLTPEILLLTCVESPQANAHRMLQQLTAGRGHRWESLLREVAALARGRAAPGGTFDRVVDDNRRVPLSDELLLVLDEALTLARAREEVYLGTEHVLEGMTDRRVPVRTGSKTMGSRPARPGDAHHAPRRTRHDHDRLRHPGAASKRSATSGRSSSTASTSSPSSTAWTRPPCAQFWI